MQLPVVQHSAPNRAQPAVRGEAALRFLDRGFQRLERVFSSLVPANLNPLEQTGAIANLNFIVALLSGVLLLVWYSASVHQAYASLTAMEQSLLPSLVRSLHRYSSDGCLFFVLIHAVKVTFARRVTGARWLAWVTGCLLLAMLVAVGWLGYWLVWDQRAQGVALGTASLADTLPIFAEPLARSFLTDEGINSLLFFVVFFAHMLLPAAMGVVLWLHISRMSRSRFLTGRAMTLWVLASLIALSLLLPATTAAPARMAEPAQRYTMDWWYLFPLVLTDRLSGGAVWALFLVGGAAFIGAPWWLKGTGAPEPAAPDAAPRVVRPATTDTAKCNSCNTCFNDCPYMAISMIPRTDGRTDYPTESLVNVDRCVGCGICAGSCDSAGVGLLDWLPLKDERRRIEGWLKLHEGDPAGLIFVCAEGAGRELPIDRESGRCEQLPGYYALSVPCLGWVNAYLVDRALERGASHVVLAGCGPDGCAYREGYTHTQERIEGKRKPISKLGAASDPRIHLLAHLEGQEEALLGATASIRAGTYSPPPAPRGARVWLGGLVVAAVLSGLTWLGSDLPYVAPVPDHPVLVVSFKLMGHVSEVKRMLTPEELAKLPIHMRPKDGAEISERRHADIRLRVSVDGTALVERTLAPGGLWGDKNSIALEELEVSPGSHRVKVDISDSLKAGEWTFVGEETVEFEPGRRRVVLFDRTKGFTWH